MNPAEDLPEEVRDRAYHAQPVWKRIVVIAAGPGGEPGAGVRAAVRLLLRDRRRRRPRATSARSRRATRRRACCSRATSWSPSTASAATPEQLSQQIATHTCAEDPPTKGCKAATPATLMVVRDGKRAHDRAHADLRPGGRAHAARLRLRARPARRRSRSARRLDLTADRFWFITKETLELPARLIDPEQRKEISGVVGSYEVTRQTILNDVADVVGILAIISLSLAIVNLFPFLPLDGGHIFWAIVEKVRRKPVPFAVMERAGVVGFMLVILLFLIGLSNDIDRLSGEGFQVR